MDDTLKDRIYLDITFIFNHSFINRLFVIYLLVPGTEFGAMDTAFCFIEHDPVYKYMYFILSEPVSELSEAQCH